MTWLKIGCYVVLATKRKALNLRGKEDRGY